MDILLSYIIPVYNVEDYLEECVFSILNQEHTGVEIILVDDGSTDRSAQICDEIAAQYPEVITLHEKNSGPSIARNIGIDAARGLYIAFMDSDDRIVRGSIPIIRKWILEEHTDICFMDASKLYLDGSKKPLGDMIAKSGVRNNNKLEAMRYLSARPKFSGAPWSKLYRKAFLDINHIRFPEDRRMHEDLYFVEKCIAYAQSYDALEMPYYEYRQDRSGSRTLSSIERNYIDLEKFVRETASEYTKDQRPNNEEAECVMSFVAYEYSVLLWKYASLPESLKKDAKAFLSDYKWVIKYGKAKRIIAVRKFLNLFGIEITSKAMEIYYKKALS